MNSGNQILDLDIINGETIALWAIIIGEFLALAVAYNERLRKDALDGEPFFDIKTEHKIIVISKFILFLAITYFLYVAYTHYRDRDKFDHIENKDLLIQLISASLVFIASILTSWVIIRNFGKDEAGDENQEL